MNKTKRLALATFLVWPVIVIGNPNPLGLMDSYEQLKTISENNYNKKINNLKKENKNKDSIDDVNQWSIESEFLNNTLFHTPARFLALGIKDECGFYDLATAGLLKDANGPIDQVLLQNKNDTNQKQMVSIRYFKEKVVKEKCPKSYKLSQYFSSTQVQNTISKFKLIPPTSPDECIGAMKTFQETASSPYFCKINEHFNQLPDLKKQMANLSTKDSAEKSKIELEVNLIEKLLKNINPEAKELLNNICMNLDRPLVFCHQYFKKNYWANLLNTNQRSLAMEYYCPEEFNNGTDLKRQKQACAKKLKNNPDICYSPSIKHAGLTPAQNCEETGELLIQSKLKNNSNDCPAMENNTAIINIGRLLNHFNIQKNPEIKQCSLVNAASFATFNLAAAGGDWGVKLCYDDKINEVEVCLPTLMGDAHDSELNLGRVVSKILEKTRGTSHKLICEAISQNEYRPELLKFKSGCHIVIDSNNCSIGKCQMDIWLDQKKVTHIKSKQEISISYSPISYQKEKFAQTTFLKESGELKNISIKSVSKIKNIFKENPNAIIHGIGCAEDLLPDFFGIEAINQCTPLPFIADTLITSSGRYAMITRTAIDQISSPRIISWVNIQAGVKRYQSNHPLQIWSLYATY